MALKKSELYSTLWSSCDELRGGMDASQYKVEDRILRPIKYNGDKDRRQPSAPITSPPGTCFTQIATRYGQNHDTVGRLTVPDLPRRGVGATFPPTSSAVAV